MEGKPDPALTKLARRLAVELLAAACADDTPNMPLAGRLEEAAPAVLGPYLKLAEEEPDGDPVGGSGAPDAPVQ